MIESRSMNQCGRRDLNPHTHWVSDFKSEASADSATAAHITSIPHFPRTHKPGFHAGRHSAISSISGPSRSRSSRKLSFSRDQTAAPMPSGASS